jgi:hypothetical protein
MELPGKEADVLHHLVPLVKHCEADDHPMKATNFCKTENESSNEEEFVTFGETNIKADNSLSKYETWKIVPSPNILDKPVTLHPNNDVYDVEDDESWC